MPDSARSKTTLLHALRSLSGLAFVSFLLLLTGTLLSLLAFERYQPLEATAVLQLLALGILAAWIWLAAQTWRLARPPARPWQQSLGLLRPAVLPWVFASLLWLNGAVDRSAPSPHETVVVTKHAAAARWVPAFRYEVVVQSWRPGRAYESVLIGEGHEFDSFQPGDGVRVMIRAGLLGLPWIARLTREEEPAPR